MTIKRPSFGSGSGKKRGMNNTSKKGSSYFAGFIHEYYVKMGEIHNSIVRVILLSNALHCGRGVID